VNYPCGSEYNISYSENPWVRIRVTRECTRDQPYTAPIRSVAMLEDKYSMEGARDADGGPPQWQAYQAWTAGGAHGTDIVSNIQDKNIVQQPTKP
jgi:hypothetical protein